MAKEPKKIDINSTIAICRVLINGEQKITEIPARSDKAASTRYSQEAVITAGDYARPLPYEHTYFDPENKLTEGVYIFPADAFKLNNYGTPELNRYAELIYVGPMTDDQKSNFARKKADMSDILG